MRTQTEIDAILADVQARFDARRQVTGLDLRVPQQGYQDVEDWLSIIVTPVDESVRVYDYVQALGEVQRELRANGVKHVILVPALPN